MEVFKNAKWIWVEDNSPVDLTTDKLESLVLDFDETFRNYKQVTALRSVSGSAVVDYLNSPQFQELDRLEELLEV